LANTPPIRSSPGGDSRTEKRAPSRNAKASHISTIVKTSALLWRHELRIGERGGGHEYNQDKHDELALLVALSTLWGASYTELLRPRSGSLRRSALAITTD
jgi:hypothetical protein